MTKHLSRLGYCPYLLTSPTHCTLTNFANHVDNMSHDAINRFLRREHTSQAAQDACGLRWKIEPFHCEIKQLTGLQHCQCCKARIQRNPIASAVLVWIRLASLARQTAGTLYERLRFA